MKRNARQVSAKYSLNVRYGTAAALWQLKNTVIAINLKKDDVCILDIQYATKSYDDAIEAYNKKQENESF